MDDENREAKQALEGLTLEWRPESGRIGAVHGLRGSLALPNPVSAGLPDIKFMSLFSSSLLPSSFLTSISLPVKSSSAPHGSPS